MHTRNGFRWMAAMVLLAHTAHADSLQWLSAPAVVRFGSDIQCSIQYQADVAGNPKSVVAGIAPAGATNRWIGVTRAEMGFGSGTLNLKFKLDSVPGNLDQAFVLAAHLVEEGGGFRQVTARAPDRPVTVKADRLSILQAPHLVENGQVFGLRFGYVMESNGWLKADLLKPGAPAGSDWFGGASVALPAGTGTVTAIVTVEGMPPAGCDYEWSAFAGPDTSVSNATCTAREGPIRVVADALDFYSSPAVVTPNQEVAVTLDYATIAAPQGKYLKVNLLYLPGGYAYFGGTNVSLPAGSGRTTVQFRVEGSSPVSSTNYIFDAFIARNGDDWDKATAHDQVSVELQADAVSFNTYPTEIWTPNTWTVKVNYAAAAQRIIQVNLLTPAPDYTYRASGVVTVQTGSGVATVRVAVPNTFLSGWHIWSTFSAPIGGGWENRTADATSPQIWVTRDPVKIVAAPTNVQRGVRCYVQLSWEVLQASEIHIDLVRDGTYTWHGGAWTNIPAGTGTNLFAVTVDPAAPIDTNYLWSSWVGPVGQGYENRTAEDVFKFVRVEP